MTRVTVEQVAAARERAGVAEGQAAAAEDEARQLKLALQR